MSLVKKPNVFLVVLTDVRIIHRYAIQFTYGGSYGRSYGYTY